MFNKIKSSFLLSLTVALTFLADIATSTSTICLVYEPECPEELLK